MILRALIPAAIAVAAAPALAADAPLFGQWQTQCAGAGSCQAYVNLAEEATGKLALTASVHYVAGAPAPTMLITLPLGVALAPGVQVEAGPDKQRLAMKAEACFPDGCRFAAEIGPEAIAALDAAPTFTVRFFVYAKDNELREAAVPTEGLKQALAYVVARPAKTQP